MCVCMEVSLNTLVISVRAESGVNFWGDPSVRL